MPLQLVGLTLLLLLVAILYYRKAYERFPLFCAYLIFIIIATLIQIVVAADYLRYFRVFWTVEALDEIFVLFALYEAFRTVFFTDFKTWPWFKLIFPGTVVLLSVLLIGNALLHHPAASESEAITTIIISFENVVNCVLAGLFLMFLALAWLLLGQSWPTYPYGVVFGFAISTAGTLLAFWLRSIFGTKLNWLGRYGPPVSYIVAVLVWIASCYLPREPEDRWRNLQGNDPEEAIATVRQYMKALRRITGKDR
jgi:hypothetical protein